ncbi:sigma-70 family RNA polymerase sigma factor [Sphaerotilus sp.]|uniref:sigma-70 family RNA polymerase sigma factor n=1 Tax=Sphaerotilus sp. TaxID=2093942 RepID=UPI002ACD9FB8|nr:sigma-70 family RNA polymerase sigma factor [Sphaerotilus sp.]MDZ7855868.1 sigma-70 family RNA polymerase sigma factor [Sphaerotilus sp.]
MPTTDRFPQDGWASLYGAHRSWLVTWLRRRLDCHHAAADLAQDTFVRVITAQVRPELIETPRAYLSAIAGRLVSNHYRRQSLERAWLETLAALPEALVPSAEERALAFEALRQLDAALARLPAAVRQAFLLAQLDGHSAPEIARDLGVTERTVRRYLERAFAACILELA